jgi:ATP-dependent protease ClpP protease subunit
MNATLNFAPQFAQLLPATHALLQAANLLIHPAVSRIILHGSRGLAGGGRSDSDIDLSLIIENSAQTNQTKLEHWRYSILETTFTA